MHRFVCRAYLDDLFLATLLIRDLRSAIHDLAEKLMKKPPIGDALRNAVHKGSSRFW